MSLLVRVIAIVALTAGTGAVANHLGPRAGAAPVLVLLGGVSFFIGPEADGAGFFVKGLYVDAPTPGCVWRGFGIILWIGAAVVLAVAWWSR